MDTYSFSIAISCFIIIILLSGPCKLASAEQFTFHKESTFIDESKILHLYGEVTNISENASQNVVIRAVFYDANGNLLNEFQADPVIRVMNPGTSSPFEIKYIGSKSVGNVKNFTLSATGSATKVKDSNLRIIVTNSRLDILGTYYINGVIRNDGPETATNTLAIATLYDKEGSVIAIGEALAEARDGTSDIRGYSEAPFGMAIIDRLQTYKTSSYFLSVDSDQYTFASNLQNQIPPSTQNNGTIGSDQLANKKNGCLIATAAFGSELAPQVQSLRGFRDGIVLHTFAGSKFMDIFDGWYYSFSPSVADYERQNPWLQNIVRYSIYPLLEILQISTLVYENITFSKEIAIVSTGIVASIIIGTLYFMPVIVGIYYATGRRRLTGWKMSKYLLASIIVASLSLITVAELTGSSLTMMIGTASLVLTLISASTLGGLYGMNLLSDCIVAWRH